MSLAAPLRCRRSPCYHPILAAAADILDPPETTRAPGDTRWYVFRGWFSGGAGVRSPLSPPRVAGARWRQLSTRRRRRRPLWRPSSSPPSTDSSPDCRSRTRCGCFNPRSALSWPMGASLLIPVRPQFSRRRRRRSRLGVRQDERATERCCIFRSWRGAPRPPHASTARGRHLLWNRDLRGRPLWCGRCPSPTGQGGTLRPHHQRAEARTARGRARSAPPPPLVRNRRGHWDPRGRPSRRGPSPLPPRPRSSPPDRAARPSDDRAAWRRLIHCAWRAPSRSLRAALPPPRPKPRRSRRWQCLCQYGRPTRPPPTRERPSRRLPFYWRRRRRSTHGCAHGRHCRRRPPPPCGVPCSSP